MYTYKAKALRVIDGDTVKLEVDCGFNLKYTANFRLWGINAPELGAPEGTAAKERLIDLLYYNETLPFVLTIETSKPDKYGRWLAKIWNKNIDGKYDINLSINDIMINEGFAVEYMRDN